jgi:polyketide cyclase/dehydrase/lipid transport protein
MDTELVRHVSVTIHRPPAFVYAFAAVPANLPSWAKGLSGSIEKVGEEWIADSPMGTVKIRFTQRNMLGVLDHDVVLPSGETVHNPMRVVANGLGSEVVFTLFRRPGVSDEEFAADAVAVERDLETLKRVVEALA